MCHLKGMAQSRTCGTVGYMKEQIEKNPAIKEQLEEIERHAQSYVPTQAKASILQIPVVVHVVYNNAVQNISDAQILSQIDILNQDFRRTNVDAINTPTEFLGVAADTEIEFCLANVDPNGFMTNGITRTATTTTAFGTSDNIKNSGSGGKDPWNTAHYLNMWVGNLGGTLLGYAQFPGGPPATDGTVIDYRYFGNIGTATAPFHLGRTATHEVGHYLNLSHIWGDGGCSVDDGITDTPLAGSPNTTSAPCTHPARNSCTETPGPDLPDMFQNFMDYSDDACMNLFTIGQKDRMRSLFTSNGARAELLNSQGCANTGMLTSCSDGFANGDETGIDCGGSCPSCITFCMDGIQNGDEVGIDCGGSCDPCPPGIVETCETALQITNNGTYTAPGPSSGMGASNPTGSSPRPIHANWYLFVPQSSGTMTIRSCMGGVDTRLWIYEGCCNDRTRIAGADDNCLRSPGDFVPGGAASEITGLALTKGKQYYIEWDDRWSSNGFDFTFTFTPTSTCGDGVQNGDETGIDCGGASCAACDGTVLYCQDDCANCPTCTDGIQNGEETGIDCGGNTCADCPICIEGDCIEVVVPTFSQWGLFLFALLILNFFVGIIRQELMVENGAF